MNKENDNRYTKEGLPKLKFDTVNVFERDINQNTSIKNMGQDIKEENEEVARYIGLRILQYPEEQRHIISTELIALYSVLKNQAQNYQLEDMVNHKQSK
jgi:hypothetical protein